MAGRSSSGSRISQRDYIQAQLFALVAPPVADRRELPKAAGLGKVLHCSILTQTACRLLAAVGKRTFGHPQMVMVEQARVIGPIGAAPIKTLEGTRFRRSTWASISAQSAETAAELVIGNEPGRS